MPANLIPSQAANLNQMLDGEILHGRLAEGVPYLKDTFDAVINNVNLVSSESNATPGASKIGVKTNSFSNFTKATNDVEACLEGIDSALGTGKQVYPMFVKFLFKYPSMVEFNVEQGGTVQSITAELGIDAGTLIDQIDNITGFSTVDAGNNITLDTNNYLAGSGAVQFDKLGTNQIARIRKSYTAPGINGTSGRVRLDVYLPTVTGVSNVRVYFHSNVGADYSYWNVTLNVEGNALVAGWNKIEVDLSSIPSGGLGAFNVGAITEIDYSVVTTLAATTLTGVKFNNCVMYKPATDSTLLDFDVVHNYNTILKGVADTYTFEALHAGVPVGKTVFNPSPYTVATDDVISLNLKSIPSYAGQNLKVTVVII